MPSLRELLTGQYAKRERKIAVGPDVTYVTRPVLDQMAFRRQRLARRRRRQHRAGKQRARGIRQRFPRLIAARAPQTPRTGRVVSRVLRYYADHNEWVRVAINHRKRQISQANWHIQRINDPSAKPNPKIVSDIQKLFNFVNPKAESFPLAHGYDRRRSADSRTPESRKKKRTSRATSLRCGR